ncbi:hypothetical protein LTR36_010510 [Oleoguttula mirabilis]|uniref:Uncharacterized protein n=1 Tax=Oleoguttula mirabilis TaxID=1507867 RepID=A0AAV9J4S9_9PEZI|nr:hypothetical protein LTR36_010510 [Oleoguttula mirabilis]
MDIDVLCMFVEHGGLRRFLGELKELEGLDLRMRSVNSKSATPAPVYIPLSIVFGNLRFSDLWLEPAELCELLGRHASTLEEVTLANINLGETALTRSPQQSTHVIAMTGMRQAYPEWEAVARTCQAMSRLAGLLLEAPSVDVLWEVLGVFEVEDLMERGMGERGNRLGVRGFADLWEQVEGLGR